MEKGTIYCATPFPLSAASFTDGPEKHEGENYKRTFYWIRPPKQEVQSTISKRSHKCRLV